MTFYVLVVGDWRDQTSAAKFDAMINAVNNSGAKYMIAVGDYSGCIYNIAKVVSLITIPKYIMPGNHESSNCATGVPGGVAGKYYPSIEGTGVQAEFAATCAQKTYNKIVSGSPAIVGQHKSFFNCIGCRYGPNGTDPIIAPPNAVLAVCGDSHCPAIGGTSTCIYINESSPMGTPAIAGCGEANKMSYVEFDDSVAGKLTLRVQRIPAMSPVSRPTTWIKTITVNTNIPTTTYKCSGAPNYTCTAVTDGSGQYTTMAECQAACQAPITKYKCSGAPNYTCVADPTGTYNTLAECQAVCHSGDMTLEQLHAYNGKNGMSAYVAVSGIIYDVTNNSTWINGTHYTVHLAGNDLTAAFDGKHNDNRMSAFPVVGHLIVATKYKCSGAPNYTCIADPTGIYNTLAECQAACQPPSVLTSIAVSPTSASVGINSTTQLTAVCKNQNGVTMTCPTLTWTSTDITKAMVSQSGLVTGVAIGTTNIIAVSGQVASNISTITVTTLPQISLQQIVENVTGSIGYRYQTKDSSNNTVDTIKIIENPSGGYLGVYHTLIGGTFRVKLAISTDLKTWTYRIDLDNNASQPYIIALSDGSFLVAMEGTLPNLHLRFKHYANLNSLMAGIVNKTFDAPRTIPNAGAEGTPNIYSATINPDINNSIIDVGFHYFRNSDVDRQARGTLTNFSQWTARVETQVNTILEALGVNGNLGDRDNVTYNGKSYNIIEGQLTKGNWASWRCFLYDWSANTAVQLNIRTHKGSTTFANPSFTKIKDPSGNSALATTLFIPSEGAVTGESGELIYYSRITEVMKWKCSGTPDYICIQAIDGIYNTLEECQTACHSSVMKYTYKPVYKCVEDPNGQCNSLEECKVAAEAKGYIRVR